MPTVTIKVERSADEISACEVKESREIQPKPHFDHPTVEINTQIDFAFSGRVSVSVEQSNAGSRKASFFSFGVSSSLDAPYGYNVPFPTEEETKLKDKLNTLLQGKNTIEFENLDGNILVRTPSSGYGIAILLMELLDRRINDMSSVRSAVKSR